MIKLKKNYRSYLIYLLRMTAFFLFPAVFATAFSGVKSILIQIGQGKSLSWNAFLTTLLAVVVFTVIFGRFFCGFICSFGTLGDIVYEISSIIRKKRKKKPLFIPARAGEILRFGKFLILALILVFCALLGTDWISSYSPWTVFSRLQSGMLPEFGVGAILLILIVIGMAFEKRFFCRFLCPMGAVFALLPVLPISAIRRHREDCLRGCSGCKRVCPANLEIADHIQQDSAVMGECFSCGACIGVCPKSHVETGLVRKKEHVFYWHLLRFGIFFLGFYLLSLL